MTPWCPLLGPRLGCQDIQRTPTVDLRIELLHDIFAQDALILLADGGFLLVLAEGLNGEQPTIDSYPATLLVFRRMGHHAETSNYLA